MKVIVISVHPDDETLGCGGTLLKHKQAGDELFWLIGTTMAGYKNATESNIKRREKEIALVSHQYGFKEVFQFSIPAIQVDTVPFDKIVSEFTSVFKKTEPNIVYLPFCHDVHSDHRIMFNAAYSCTKRFRSPYVNKVLMMETLSETDFAPSISENAFIPNFFVDISAHIEKKIEIMKLYKSELGVHPFPRSEENIRALAIHRGARANFQHAESFMLLNEFWK